MRIEVHHFIHIDDDDARALASIAKSLVRIEKEQVTMSEQLNKLNAKLDEIKVAASAEREEVLASLATIKAMILVEDLSGAIAKADEAIASVQAVHAAADDAV